MSLKPVKESDLRKSWMRKRTGSRVAISPEYHLIITEGTKTEPGYFEGLRDAINSRFRGRIQLDIEGTGMNTMSILERTIQLDAANNGRLPSSSAPGTKVHELIGKLMAYL